MKQVNVYTSKAGQGKSFVMMIDAVKMAASGKKVAYITAELNDRFVIKRMNHIAKYFGFKGKISKGNLVVFQVPYGGSKDAFNKIESIKKEFDILFVDPFEGIHSYDHSSEIPQHKRTQDAYVRLVDLLDSTESNLESMNVATYCYSKPNDEIVFIGSESISDDLKGRVSLKVYCNRDYCEGSSKISVSDYQEGTIKEYNISEIMK
jgi:hypothetical protein